MENATKDQIIKTLLETINRQKEDKAKEIKSLREIIEHEHKSYMKLMDFNNIISEELKKLQNKVEELERSIKLQETIDENIIKNKSKRK